VNIRKFACLAFLAVTSAPAHAADRPDILWQLGGHYGKIRDVAFSPDGQLAVSAGDDAVLKIWHVASGNLQMSLTVPAGNFASAFQFDGACFSPDGQEVWGATIGASHAWRVSDGQFLRALGNMESTSQTFFSRDGQYIGVAGSPAGSEDATHVFNRADGTLVHMFEPAGSVAAVFSADGQFVIAGTSISFQSPPGVMRYYRMSDGGLERTINAHGGPIQWLALSPDGTLLASCSDDHTVKLWNAADGSLRDTLTEAANTVYRVRFSPDGTRLAATSFDGGLRIYDATTGNLIETLNPVGGLGAGAFDWSPDSQRMLVANGSAFSTHLIGNLRTVEANGGQLIKEFLQLRSLITDLAISPDGTRFSIVEYVNSVRVHDVASSAAIWAQPPASLDARVAFSGDGQRLAVAEDNGTIRFRRASDGILESTHPAHAGAMTDVAFAPNNQILATTRFGEAGKVWNYPGLSLQTSLPHTANAFAPIEFMPDSQSLLTGSGNQVIQSHASNGAIIQGFSGHTAGVRDVAVNGAGTRILTGSIDQSAKLWNAATGTLIRTHASLGGWVDSVALSPDGRIAVTGTVHTDRSMRLWSVATGALLAQYRVDTGTGPLRITFSPDSRTILFGRSDACVVAIRNPYAGIVGDVNGDGSLDLLDAEALAAVLIGQPLAVTDEPRADVNEDGLTNGHDVQAWVLAILAP